MPLTGNRLWDKIHVKLLGSVLLSLPVSIYLYSKGHMSALVSHLLFDYIPFIVLLGALFIISGGIFISARQSGKPYVNVIFMATGAVLASFIGTTGASMLLIRPLIRSNEIRTNKTHIIVFFIAIVANTGGMLTPLGDPALFILYLRDVPFEWFLNLLPEWAMINLLLIGLFYLVDRKLYLEEFIKKLPRRHYSGFHFRLYGTLNLLWMAGVIVAVSLINEKNFPGLAARPYLKYIRELIIILMAVLSLVSSSKRNLKRNAFSWGPILEVAALFLGIFVTMIPALLYLEQHAGMFGIRTTGEFYFATGFLSSILDNTPTAAVFHSLASVVSESTVAVESMGTVPGADALLTAIAVGAVAFGSMTYIGNGPNFMVKAIAENNGIAMPGFFKYIFRYSVLYFLPIYILVYFIFLM